MNVQQLPVTRTYRQQETRLLTAVTRAPLVLLTLFVDGTVVFATQDGLRVMGIDLTAALSRHYKDLFSGVPSVVGVLDRAFAGHIVHDTLTINGRPWDVRFFPTYDSQNNIAGVVGILTDASDRLSSFRLMRTLDVLSSLRAYLSRTDATDAFLQHVCETVEHAYPAAWIGIADCDAVAEKAMRVITAPSSKAAPVGAMGLSYDGRHLFAQAFASGKTKLVCDIERSPDCAPWCLLAGEHSWKGLLAVPFVRQGSSFGVLNIFSGEAAGFAEEEVALLELIASEIADGITILEDRAANRKLARQREAAEERYRTLVETVFDIVITIDAGGKISGVNRAGLGPTGAGEQSDLVGTPLTALVVPEHRRRVGESLARTDADVAPEILEFRILGLDGSVCDVEGTIVRVNDDGPASRICVLRDITERNLHQKALADAKASLDYAQQIASMGHINLDVTSGNATWSKNALAIVDLPQGMDTGGLVDTLSYRALPEDKHLVHRLLDDMIRTGEPANTEVRMRLASEAIRSIHVHGIPLHGSPSALTRKPVEGIFLVIQDVTSFRRIEDDLKVTTERLLRAQEIGKTGDFEIDLSAKQVSLSQTACRILGLSQVESIVCLSTLYRQLIQEDQAKLRELVEEIRAHRAQELSFDCRLSRDVSDEPACWINLQARSIASGEYDKLSGNVQDITERKVRELAISKREARLAHAQMVAGLWEFTWDVQADRITWSPTIASVLGFEPPVRELSFEQLINSIAPAYRERFRQAAENTLNHGERGEVEYVQTLLKGVTLRVLSRWEPVLNQDGTITEIIGITQNVTSLREAQERIARKEHFHPQTRLPDKIIVYDRLHYLRACAHSPLSLVAIGIQGYKALRDSLGDDTFYGILRDAILEAQRQLKDVDLFAHLEKGKFLIVFDTRLTDDAAASIAAQLSTAWESVLRPKGEAIGCAVRVRACVVNCPEDTADVDAVLPLIERRLDA